MSSGKRYEIASESTKYQKAETRTIAQRFTPSEAFENASATLFKITVDSSATFTKLNRNPVKRHSLLPFCQNKIYRRWKPRNCVIYFADDVIWRPLVSDVIDKGSSLAFSENSSIVLVNDVAKHSRNPLQKRRVTLKHRSIRLLPLTLQYAKNSLLRNVTDINVPSSP